MIHPDATGLVDTRPGPAESAAARPARASATARPRLVVRTEPVDELAPLIPRADPRHPLLWMRRGEGIVGLGETLRVETSGAGRIKDAAAAWTELAGHVAFWHGVEVIAA